MMSPELAEVAEKLKGGRPIEPVTVRTFLWWFGAQRRGYNKVAEIRRQLAEAGVETDPDFEARWVDAPISFKLSSGSIAQPESVEESSNDYQEEIQPTVNWITRDPTYRVSKLAAANQKVVFVAPDAAFQEIVTLLLARDFSQLPEMTTPRTVKGMVSWKSIGCRLALGQNPKSAQDVLDDYHEIRSDQSIFEAIPLVRKYDYVLVRADDNTITGIITGSDLSLQFHSLSEPFLLLSEIENAIRNMIGSKFSINELSLIREPGNNRPMNSVDDLTFGEYLKLLQDANHWPRLGVAIDRNIFCKDLEEVRQLRNDVMHFDPDGVTPDDLEKLRDFRAFLQTIDRILS